VDQHRAEFVRDARNVNNVERNNNHAVNSTQLELYQLGRTVWASSELKL
jgi:hypothetical protein